MRARICLLSVSSLVSPGPLVPMPPPSRERSVPLPARRGRRYLFCAISTCRRPSWVVALCAKMSRMSIVRSIVNTSQAFSMFLICVAVSSLSKTILLTSSCLHSSAISSSLPVPIQLALSYAGRFCTTLATTSPPAVCTSSSSSSSDTCISYLPRSAAASSTLSGLIVLSVISGIMIYLFE